MLRITTSTQYSPPPILSLPYQPTTVYEPHESITNRAPSQMEQNNKLPKEDSILLTSKCPLRIERVSPKKTRNLLAGEQQEQKPSPEFRLKVSNAECSSSANFVIARLKAETEGKTGEELTGIARGLLEHIRQRRQSASSELEKPLHLEEEQERSSESLSSPSNAGIIEVRKVESRSTVRASLDSTTPATGKGGVQQSPRPRAILPLIGRPHRTTGGKSAPPMALIATEMKEVRAADEDSSSAELCEAVVSPSPSVSTPSSSLSSSQSKHHPATGSKFAKFAKAAQLIKNTTEAPIRKRGRPRKRESLDTSGNQKVVKKTRYRKSHSPVRLASKKLTARAIPPRGTFNLARNIAMRRMGEPEEENMVESASDFSEDGEGSSGDDSDFAYFADPGHDHEIIDLTMEDPDDFAHFDPFTYSPDEDLLEGFEPEENDPIVQDPPVADVYDKDASDRETLSSLFFNFPTIDEDPYPFSPESQGTLGLTRNPEWSDAEWIEAIEREKEVILFGGALSILSEIENYRVPATESTGDSYPNGEIEDYINEYMAERSRSDPGWLGPTGPTMPALRELQKREIAENFNRNPTRNRQAVCPSGVECPHETCIQIEEQSRNAGNKSAGGTQQESRNILSFARPIARDLMPRTACLRDLQIHASPPNRSPEEEEYDIMRDWVNLDDGLSASEDPTEEDGQGEDGEAAGGQQSPNIMKRKAQDDGHPPPEEQKKPGVDDIFSINSGKRICIG
ncbi:hypothetical protein H072_11357 [Dactylellina haptotyla CBS 200.50]|uniref:Uncharacterized protein n=1 Tax=Dactylellina haptotyla (strain CBS 200.50) TaxID=1284197 RepID=S8B8F3_DACHA|nr:hypothetical protein H072_11357 [Dactylellina haptotyla CBS 200.50]